MRSNGVFRIRAISLCLVGAALILVGRLYFVQIVYGEWYAEKADRQYVQSNENLFERGTIFFQDKDKRLVAAATVKSGFTVALNPTKISDPEKLYEKLAPQITLEKSAFLLRAGKKDDPHEEVASRLEPEKAAQIEELKEPGVAVYKERWRFYPGSSLAAQTIGFVGYDDSGTKIAGRYGLERFYEQVLVRDNSNRYVNFFAEVFSGIGKALSSDSANAGDIITSLEPSVQLFLERQLKNINDTWHAKRTGGIIIDPNTGSIYAIGLGPSFNPNEFQKEADPAVFQNHLVSGVYEMGSIIKPLTMAAGLDAGVVTATTTYNDHGFLELDGKKISNFDGKGRGVVSMQEVLNQSLNTGAAFVVSRLGNKRFADYFRSFGLGEETGVDLPSEAHGFLNNLESPRNVEYATASFGQGIAMTPIGTVRALSALGNGGVLVTPHIATEIKYETGLSKTLSYNDGVRVLKPETSEEITRMLVSVVDTALLGGTVRLPHYSVAAKTGTAQIAKEGERGYYGDRYLHSFFGYFPAYDPRFLVFLYTLEPENTKYASQTLTMPFIETVKFLINYYNIAPDR